MTAKQQVRIDRVKQRQTGLMDLPYLLLTLLLAALGLIMLYSASYARAYYVTGNSASYFTSQLVYVLMGVGVLFAISRVPYAWYRKLAFPILGVSVALLMLVSLTSVGSSGGGAERWINLGFVSFQPSEIAKFGVIVSFSALMEKFQDRMKDFVHGFLPFLLILGVIAGLLYLQPHMSATMIILMLGFVMMLVGGSSWKYLGALIVAGAALAAIYLLTQGYTSDRIMAWRNPDAYASDEGYQILQSEYAIGSGGLLGLGFGKGRQKYLYLPEEHNDYIFAIACEELGFVGAIGILLLFSLLILRGFWIAIHAKDRFSMLLGVGLTTLLAIQVILNVAVVSNLLPSTGISLPFFSSGGTAVIMQLVECGIMLNISRSID